MEDVTSPVAVAFLDPNKLELLDPASPSLLA